MVLAMEREKKKNTPLISVVNEAVRIVPILGVNQPLLKKRRKKRKHGPCI